MSSGRCAIRGIGRHQHLPRPAVLVEVVDVVGAERAGERVVDVVDRHAELLRLFAVGVHEELRDGRAPQRLRAAELRVGVRAREERLRDFGEPLRAAVAAILDVELEPARRAEAEDRRRIERQHQRLLDAHRPAEQLADEARRGHLALVPGHLHDEERRRVVAKAAADEIEAGERDDVLVRRVGADGLLDLLHDLVRALERRAVRQEHGADVEALVLVGDEAARREFPQARGDRHHRGKEHDADAPAPEHPDHAVGVVAGDAREPAVEPGEEAPRRPVAVLQHHDAERGRQRQRDDAGDDHRDRDGHRELAIELAGQAAEESDRHEHRAQRQHDRDDRPSHFAHRLDRGLARRAASPRA